MDDYIKLAKEYILKHAGIKFDIIEEAIVDYDDVFCFYYQSKKYLETRNFSDMYVGQGPIFIIKADKRFVSYGSAWGEENALKNLRRFLKIEVGIRKNDPSFDCFASHYYLRQDV